MHTIRHRQTANQPLRLLLQQSCGFRICSPHVFKWGQANYKGANDESKCLVTLAEACQEQPIRYQSVCVT